MYTCVWNKNIKELTDTPPPPPEKFYLILNKWKNRIMYMCVWNENIKELIDTEEFYFILNKWNHLNLVLRLDNFTRFLQYCVNVHEKGKLIHFGLRLEIKRKRYAIVAFITLLFLYVIHVCFAVSTYVTRIKINVAVNYAVDNNAGKINHSHKKSCWKLNNVLTSL